MVRDSAVSLGRRALAHALRIEPDERRLVAWGAATVFLIEWAAVLVANVSETLFLKRIGVEFSCLVR